MFTFLKKSDAANSYSSLHLLKSSYLATNHNHLHSEINIDDIKANGFLLSNEEKQNLLFYMAFHEGKNEKIPNDSPLNKNNPGAVLLNREKQTIYKIYHPETIEEKHSRKEAKNLGVNLKSKGVVGQGAFGKLRICQDLIGGQFYAVKIIKKNLLEQLGYLIGFKALYQSNEIEFLKQEKLFIDCIETTDKSYIIEKLIDGKNLNNLFWYAKHDGKNIENFFDILIQMVSAVARFHEQGCIHRDISPDNFLYDKKENKVYLIDFGLALKLPEGYRSICNTESIGKRGYLAPEITYELFATYGFASDIYALGQTIGRITNEFSDELRYNYRFVSQIYSLANEMMANDQYLRPTLHSIDYQIKQIRREAIEEQKNKEKNAPIYPWKKGTSFLPISNTTAATFYLPRTLSNATAKELVQQIITKNAHGKNLAQLGLFATHVKEPQVTSDNDEALSQDVKKTTYSM